MKVIIQTLQLLLLLLISNSIYSQETDFITTKYVKVGYDYTFPNDAIDTFIYIRTNDVAEVSKMLQGRNKVKAFVIQNTVLTSELMDTILSREFCELYIDNTYITDATALFENLIFQRELRVLYFRLCNLYEIPEAVCCLKKLQRLEINYCFIDILPAYLSGLNHLKYLGVRNSHLRRVSDDFINPNIIVLDVSSNNFYNGFPFAICNLSGLECLDYSFNTSYPEGDCNIEYLENLHEINLRGCGLKEFPSCLLSLPNLECLYLGVNRIENFPEDSIKLSKLKFLEFYGESYKNNKEKVDAFRGKAGSDMIIDTFELPDNWW